MSTLTEIEAAADTLPAEQQQELLFFLATRRTGRAARFHRRATFPARLPKRGLQAASAWGERAGANAVRRSNGEAA